MTFGELIRAHRQGYSFFEPERFGSFSAWLRVSSHPNGLLLQFRATVPHTTKSLEEHFCWWEGTDGEGSVSRLMANRSPFLKRLVDGTEKRELPFDVVLGEDGEEVTA